MPPPLRVKLADAELLKPTIDNKANKLSLIVFIVIILQDIIFMIIS
jgi:hypothetical protein